MNIFLPLRHRGFVLLFFIFVSFAMVWTGPLANAAVVRKASLLELCAASEMGVRVQVLEVDERAGERVLQGGKPFSTEIRFQIMEVYFGENLPAELVLSLPGGKVGDKELLIPGMPTFRKGENLVLLLERAPAGNLTFTGLYQGVFRLGDGIRPDNVVADAPWVLASLGYGVEDPYVRRLPLSEFARALVICGRGQQ